MNKIKYLVLAMGLSSASVLAADLSSMPDVENNAKKGFHGQVGIAAASMPEYIGGDDTETVALPLINVSYNDTFYIKYNRLGAWVYKADNGFRLGGVVTYQKGWESSDGDLLKGRKDRDDSIMAGANVAWAQGKFSTEAGYVTDISDNSDGNKAYVQAAYTILAEPSYALSLFAKVENLDSDVTDYYYGTDDYSADSATNATLGLVGTYKINKKWTAIAAVSGTSLDDEIKDSPLVEEDTYNMVAVGVTYSF